MLKSLITNTDNLFKKLPSIHLILWCCAPLVHISQVKGLTASAIQQQS